ncbi:evolutionarily conserved signaling intermediate in Toll pathway, mitochondrial [Prorops nasuta]|uniref:evolutionarily conserved signaling intermediate in Toll pathway, mitochondrial n=1 Tax=Prorops nasuta TaxID=863751 RepID=UPI0034CECDDC
MLKTTGALSNAFRLCQIYESRWYIQNILTVNIRVVKFIHTNNYLLTTGLNKFLPVSEVIRNFDREDNKNKENFLNIIYTYESTGPIKRGHVEFIKAALSKMDEYGVNKDLECYKKILDVFPKGPYIPSNRFQKIFEHYPMQQDVTCELLTKMEFNNVTPDTEMKTIVRNIFGLGFSGPLQKISRMLYWMPKLRYLNPYHFPGPTPNEAIEQAKLAIKQMTSIDIATNIYDFHTDTIADSIDKTWVVYGISPLQTSLLELHDTEIPLYVEGPYKVWLRHVTVDYFQLRADRPVRKWPEKIGADDYEKLYIPYQKKEKILPRLVHEQEDGTYYGLCATGTSTKDSLLSWIRHLENLYPKLQKCAILFKFVSSTDELHYFEEDGNELLIVEGKKPSIEANTTASSVVPSTNYKKP